jgi:hypothetical protein
VSGTCIARYLVGPWSTARANKRGIMRLLRFGLLLSGLILALSCTAKADTVSIDGSYAFGNNGYGIPPYGGTLNGQHEAFYCVDFSHSIKAGDTWNVNITSLTGSNFSLTRLGNQTDYLAMAWLITQMMGTKDQLQIAKDQFAIWSLTGGPDPYGTDAKIVAAALAAVKAGFSGKGWEILTPTGNTGQEFLIFVPEPAVLLMLIVGLILVGIATHKRHAAGTNAA